MAIVGGAIFPLGCWDGLRGLQGSLMALGFIVPLVAFAVWRCALWIHGIAVAQPKLWDRRARS